MVGKGKLHLDLSDPSQLELKPFFVLYEATKSITTPPSPQGWDASLSQDTQYEVTRSIATPPPPPPGWDASLSQDTQYEVTRSIATPPPPLDGMLVYHSIPSMK